MSFMSDRIAQATASVVDNQAEMVHWFKDLEEAVEKLQEEVEMVLDNVSLSVARTGAVKALHSLPYRAMINGIRACKRSKDGLFRKRYMWIIGELEDMKRMDVQDIEPGAVLNMIKYAKGLYLLMQNQHINETSMIEDEMVLGVKRTVDEVATFYEAGMSSVLNSKGTKKTVKQLMADKEGRQMGEVMGARKELLDEIYARQKR